LVLLGGWSAQAVCERLPKEAALAFPCAWSRQKPLAAPSRGLSAISGVQIKAGLLTVRDCWEGVEMAHRMGWLQGEHLRGEFATSLLCSQYARTVQEYDAVWLAPGRLLVSADPMTTIFDPDPSTCSCLTPPEAPASLKQGIAADIVGKVSSDDVLSKTVKEFLSSESTTDEQGCEGSNFVSSEQSEECFPRTESSESTSGPPLRTSVREDRQSQSEPSLAMEACASLIDARCEGETSGGHAPEDFVTWCLNRNVRQVIRANFSNESGLSCIGGSYDPYTLEEHGIHHVDVPVPDVNGGVPSVFAIRRVMEACQDAPKGQATLVHCKGGFGRSVLMACCHLIAEFDLPGAALLGWVRIVRPGAIVTPQQEHFLCALRGASDLEKRLQVGEIATAKCGCVVS